MCYAITLPVLGEQIYLRVEAVFQEYKYDDEKNEKLGTDAERKQYRPVINNKVVKALKNQVAINEW